MMIETMKGICWLVKHQSDVSIAISAFADMDRLPNFDDMVTHPALIVPQKIPVDEDAILPNFTNLVEAIPSEFNVTPLICYGTHHSLSRYTSSCCIAYLATLY
jgi:hypothetical protein